MESRPVGGAKDVARSAGDTISTDAVVVGAGPVGLFQVFELGLLDIRAHVVDALPHVGGQPVELYPDKPIYDIPGSPVCTGQGLADALMQQCRPFAPVFHLAQTVIQLAKQSDDRWLLGTSSGTRLLTRTVFIAAGVGAFEPRKIKIDGLSEFEGSQLFYHPHPSEGFIGQDVLIIGDTDSAIDHALRLSELGDDRPRSVTLVHRRDSFKADVERVTQMRERCVSGGMRFIAAQPSEVETQRGRLTALRLLLADGSCVTQPVDALLVLQGLAPQLGPINGWGLALERKQLVVDTERFATSETGIFAVGDINTYPGKRKLLVCGFHECTLAAYAAAPIVHPERPVQLQYTTTSTHLQQKLAAMNSTGR